MAHKQLTSDQRYQIEILMKEKFSLTAIAEALGKSASSISREVARNGTANGYRAKVAIRKTMQRRQEAKKSEKLDTAMCSMIDGLLKEYYSPEQMMGRLKLALGVEISHETIYRYIWEDKANGGELYKYLRTQGKKYRKRGESKDKRGQIKNAVSIDERPSIVDEKSRIGDWEIDTVIGKDHKQALVTIVERATKFTVVKKVFNKSAEAVAKATIALLAPYKDRVHTITADNGKEFAFHEKVAKALECDYYFAHPYSSWERGLNENTNGLIRQFFPKGSRFQEITERDVKRVKGLLNRRPRKALGYYTPTEVFFEKFGEKKIAFQG